MFGKDLGSLERVLRIPKGHHSGYSTNASGGFVGSRITSCMGTRKIVVGNGMAGEFPAGVLKLTAAGVKFARSCGGKPERVPGTGMGVPTAKGAVFTALNTSGSKGLPVNGSSLMAVPCARKEFPCGMFPIRATL
jgi:hypothetical protein